MDFHWNENMEDNNDIALISSDRKYPDSNTVDDTSF